MGTRADFYKNIEPEKMEWLGSIAWDGYPKGKVLASNFGNPWFDPLVAEKEYADDSGIAKISFPDMSKNKKVRPPNDPGSGIMMFQ